MNFFSGEPDYVKLQNSIDYFQDKNIVTLYPSECKAFCLLLDNQEVKFIALKNMSGSTFFDHYIFLRPKITGEINLYYIYYYAHTAGGFTANGGFYSSSSMVNGWILEKSNGKNLVIMNGRSRGSREDLIDFFKDYPELCQKIKEKKINKNNIELMVAEYNKWIELSSN